MSFVAAQSHCRFATVFRHEIDARRPGSARLPTRRRGLTAARALTTVPAGMTVAGFEEMISRSDAPAVLVDFCTAWCGPCAVLDRNIKAIEHAHRGRVAFVKVDTEKSPEVADHFSIHKLPTLILFKDSQQIDRLEGLISGQDLDMRLRRLLR
ncbi:hypothetical protein ABPG77_000503 [Micractinium sp. CCAP 211/92]